MWQIADLMNLDRTLITKIVGNVNNHNADSDGKTADKRRVLSDNDWTTIARQKEKRKIMEDRVHGAKLLASC